LLPGLTVVIIGRLKSRRVPVRLTELIARRRSPLIRVAF
jgi:hypothetical protein